MFANFWYCFTLAITCIVSCKSRTRSMHMTNIWTVFYQTKFLWRSADLEKVLSAISNIWAGGFAGLNNIALYVIHAIILAVNNKGNLRYNNIYEYCNMVKNKHDFRFLNTNIACKYLRDSFMHAITCELINKIFEKAPTCECEWIRNFIPHFTVWIKCAPANFYAPWPRFKYDCNNPIYVMQGIIQSRQWHLS